MRCIPLLSSKILNTGQAQPNENLGGMRGNYGVSLCEFVTSGRMRVPTVLLAPCRIGKAERIIGTWHGCRIVGAAGTNRDSSHGKR